MNRIFLVVFVVGLLVGPVGGADVRGDVLHELFESYFEADLKFHPLHASQIGDHRYDDLYPDSISTAYRDRLRGHTQRYLSLFRAVETKGLLDADLLSLRLMIYDLEMALASLGYRSHLLPVSQFFCVTTTFAKLGSGAGAHPFKRVKDYENFLKRVDGFCVWVDTAIANMNEGVESGFVQPKLLIEKTLPQIKFHLVSDITTSVFYKPIANMPKDISGQDAERIKAAYEKMILEQILPTYRKLHTFLRDSYLPKCRESIGISDLPGGREWYAFKVRQYTTTDLSADEIHTIGLAEVARITGEMESVKQQVGFMGSLAEFFEHLRTDDAYYFSSKEELLQRYEVIKAETATKLPKWFGRLPRADYEVRAIEAYREQSAAAAHYQRPNTDGSEPGVFYVNTYNLKARANYSMIALSLHEANPGHHFQLSIQQELEDLPRFRRFGGHYTAYVEGWALYAESLGKEMGLYDDPYAYFGRLSYEIWRAMRLVVDTGIHAKGWSRQQAVDYMMSCSPLSETNVNAEVDRYIAWPGQALAYKIGELKIQNLRKMTKKILGDTFDPRAFHDFILASGALPLNILEERVVGWSKNLK